MSAASPLRYRTIWISDTHLGTAGCQANRLLDFLRHTESDYLYLVGDISCSITQRSPSQCTVMGVAPSSTRRRCSRRVTKS
jgi:UDP-2,3-diacylglucosamine pyrophosphatase LpxH